MTHWPRFLAIAAAPFVLAFILWLFRPFENWLRRVLPEGRLKRILFFTWEA